MHLSEKNITVKSNIINYSCNDRLRRKILLLKHFIIFHFQKKKTKKIVQIQFVELNSVLLLF